MPRLTQAELTEKLKLVFRAPDSSAADDIAVELLAQVITDIGRIADALEGANASAKPLLDVAVQQGVSQTAFSAWLAKHGKPDRAVCTVTNAELDAFYSEYAGA